MVHRLSRRLQLLECKHAPIRNALEDEASRVRIRRLLDDPRGRELCEQLYDALEEEDTERAEQLWRESVELLETLPGAR